MKILVTGGAGFLGSNLCERLVKNPANYVYCLDNLQTGSLENVKGLMDLPNFRFIEHDIVEPIELAVDQIYNAACPASPPAYQADPVHTLKTSVFGMLNMLELARKHNATVLQFSTSMDPADGRVISNFVNQALRGEDLTAYGDGKQTRSFCYVDDLVEGIYQMMNSAEDITGPVNLGTPGEFTMLELAEEVLEQLDVLRTGASVPERKKPGRRTARTDEAGRAQREAV